MEIPPESSFAQCSALFTGLSSKDVTNKILSITPNPGFNFLNDSTNRSVAYSSTGLKNDFRLDEFREGSRIFNGIQKYPFSSSAQIFNYKFDPYYFDGSENDPNFNVHENLIGTPLGTSLLEDPRLTYTKNLLLLKEYQGQENQLNDAYIKELYMVNSEKGSTYYQNMLERQQNALDAWSRQGRASKRPLDSTVFTYNMPQLERPPRNKSKEQMPSKTKRKKHYVQTSYSMTPSVQTNYRREKMDKLPTDARDIVNSRDIGMNTPYSDITDATPHSYPDYSIDYILEKGESNRTANTFQKRRLFNGLQRTINFNEEETVKTSDTNVISYDSVTPSPGTGFSSLDESANSIFTKRTGASLNEPPSDGMTANVQELALSENYYDATTKTNTLLNIQVGNRKRLSDVSLDTANSTETEIQRMSRHTTPSRVSFSSDVTVDQLNDNPKRRPQGWGARTLNEEIYRNPTAMRHVKVLEQNLIKDPDEYKEYTLERLAQTHERFLSSPGRNLGNSDFGDSARSAFWLRQYLPLNLFEAAEERLGSFRQRVVSYQNR